MAIIYALIIFGILVVVHEGGHFAAAKLSNIKVNEFAVGMGPLIYKKQKGETQYSLRALPIGGFCAMEGEDDSSEDERAFSKAPFINKAIVIVAGAAMNLLLTVIIMTGVIMYVGIPQTTISGFSEMSPAREAGIMQGDKVTYIDGDEIREWKELVAAISSCENSSVSMRIEREGEKLTLDVPLIKEEGTGRNIVGILPEMSRNPGIAIFKGVEATGNMAVQMLSALKQVVTGELSTKELTGVIGITVAVGDSIKYGFVYVANLTALISLNLAIVNMLPFPALDGGRLLFLIIRRVTGRAITDEVEAKVHYAGIIMLFSLMIYITWQDIGRFILNK